MQKGRRHGAGKRLQDLVAQRGVFVSYLGPGVRDAAKLSKLFLPATTT